jgi:hypothetical protein
MLAAHHVLRYLRGTYELGIRYHRHAFNSDQLWGWVDADWEGDIETRRYHTGYVLMLNGGPISWKSRDRIRWLFLPQTLYIWQPASAAKKLFISVEFSAILVSRKLDRRLSLRTISRVSLRLSTCHGNSWHTEEYPKGIPEV